MRHKVWRGLNTDEVAEPNCFAVSAAIAAYKEGGEWLDALRKYIDENRKFVSAFLGMNLPQITLIQSEATYLLWLDCSLLDGDSDQLQKFIRDTTGLYLSTGKIYGIGGEHFLRFNIACPRSRLADGLNRLKDAVEKYAVL